jgi:hypothetical protein
MSRHAGRVSALLLLVICIGVVCGSCAIVPRNRRQYLADPTMQPTVDPIGDKSASKLHTSREGAAGGDGEPAGGGCGCSN